MSYSPRHTVVSPGRSSSGSCTLSDGRVGVASASSGRHTSGGIGNGRANFSSRSHVGGGSTCAYGAGRGHFSSGSNSGVFVGGGHMVGNGSGAGSHVTVGSASGGHVGVVEGIPGGMVAGGHSGVMAGHPGAVVGGMGGVVAGHPGAVVGGMGGVVAGHPGAVVGGMGGVVAGHPGAVVGGMGGVVAGHPGAVVGGMGGVVAGHPGAVIGGMGGIAGHPGAVVGGMGGVAGTHPGMVGAPCTVVGGSPGGMIGGMGGVMGHGGMVGGMGGPVMVAAPAASGGVFLNFDGKMTMQNLNDRLASYLDKVRRLEEENSELESNIREFYAKQGSLSETKDYSHYHQQIDDLKNQLIHTSVENNKLLLSIDNNKLTADDFRTKYETECCLRQNVEADINGLHQILDQLSACRGDLDVQCENLQDELCSLKKNHTEEIACLKKQCTGDVNVEVNTCPGPDLKKILEEMRCKYEAMIEGNRKEVEAWYGSKIEEVNRDVSTSSQEIEESNNKVTELRRQLQALEIEYDAQCNLRDTLDVSLAETEHRYNSHLGELQERISGLEQQLAELRAEMECQNHEYTELLDVKSRLEHEISTYRGLLEGSQHDIVGGGGITRVSSVSSGRSGELRSPHTYVTHSAGHSFHSGRSHH